MERIVECIPNFSEGRNAGTVARIAEAIAGVGCVCVLNIDSGAAVNRTVITFAGTPEKVAEAAFEAVKTAAELIDMRLHHGEHPRIGATDVLPFVPVSGVTMEECVELARRVSERIGDELGIPVYAYENSATVPGRRNLAVCRAGEYEGLKDKMESPEWKPDFGPCRYDDRVASAGAVVCGARNFLIAINFNLDTTSVETASAIACDVRERGRKVDGVWRPGTLKGCKAIGWFIEEYGIAQVSMNITDICATPVHRAFEEVRRCAENRRVKVTGCELIGLVPRGVIAAAGAHFLNVSPDNSRISATAETVYLRQQIRKVEPQGIRGAAPLGIKETCVGGCSASSLRNMCNDNELVEAAVRGLGLGSLKPFEPRKRIIEYVLEDNGFKL